MDHKELIKAIKEGKSQLITSLTETAIKQKIAAQINSAREKMQAEISSGMNK